MYNIEVTMETVTPVWTGDAFAKGNVLKPQSILGSLRFWFEVFCYATDELDKNYEKEELDQEKFVLKINEILEREKEFSIYEAKKKALNELGISIPSQVFGCNGWEGLIKIKGIRLIDEKEIKLPKAIYKERRNYNANWKKTDDIKEIDRKKEHAWFFEKSFVFGKLGIEFEIADKKVGEEVLYPLLNFIEKYGFIGGKNNVGYGRVKFRLGNIELSDYNKFKLNNKTRMLDDVVEEKGMFEDLFKDDLIKRRKIGLNKLQNNTIEDKDILEIIKELIREKSKWRTECKNKSILKDNKRHFIFGSTCKDEYEEIEGPNATKIIPWINKIKENEYEYGFISLVLLKYFPKEVK